MPIIVDPTSSAAHVEAIVLDPSEVATGRTEFDISNIIKSDGVDWGDAAIEAYMAEATRGQVPVDYRVPNRIVSIPLVIKDTTAVTFDVARQVLQAKIGLFHREGGWLKREINGVPWYADVVNATLKLGGSALQALRSFDVDATLQLECLPDFYGDEITLDDMTETTNPELVKVLKLSSATAAIKGDYPARARIVVDEDQGVSQLGLLWGLRSRHYDSAATAALAYQAEALTPLDQAVIATVTGASGGGSNNVVKHPSLGPAWTPVLSTDLAGTGPLTHTGSYRVWARCHTTSTTPPQVRLVWDVGDMLMPVENTRASIPAAGFFYLLDLGEIRLDPTGVGTHQWGGAIQAIGASADISIDRLSFQPLDESAGALTATARVDVGLAGYAARDEFNQSAGSLSGKTAAVGGNWSGAGSATDFTVNATTHALNRSATSDAGEAGGRSALLGASTFASVAVQADVSWASSGSDFSLTGVLARHVNTSNWLHATFVVDGSSPSRPSLRVTKCVAGTITILAIAEHPSLTLAYQGKTYTVRLAVDPTGSWSVWVYEAGTTPTATPTLTGVDANLATGGTLASGNVGAFDYGGAISLPYIRTIDNFAAWVPAADAVLFASKSAEMRSDGVSRASTSGSYGPIAPSGDLPRLPPSGLESRPVELLVKASRSDFAQVPDSGIDDISARVYYRPSWLFVPE